MPRPGGALVETVARRISYAGQAESVGGSRRARRVPVSLDEYPLHFRRLNPAAAHSDQRSRDPPHLMEQKPVCLDLQPHFVGVELTPRPVPRAYNRAVRPAGRLEGEEIVLTDE